MRRYGWSAQVPVRQARVACYRPGDRPHLYGHLRAHRRRKGEPKGFTWQDYRELIIATHHNLSAPLVWCWITSTSTSRPNSPTSLLRTTASEFPGP
jgi:hypothetical protein